MTTKTTQRLLAPVLAALVALGLAACGDDESSGGSGAGNGVDRAFVGEMVPHHESAVEMARIAQRRATHGDAKKLADAIVRTQNAEIEVMTTLAQDLDDAGVEKSTLGVPTHEMGMSGDTSMLETSKPFDRAFIDLMIPHHQGAIKMARAELERGESSQAKQLAQAIIKAQAREIDEMNTWRVSWYGGISPAGGVPPEARGSEAR